jgi:hypothetical protein
VSWSCHGCLKCIAASQCCKIADVATERMIQSDTATSALHTAEHSILQLGSTPVTL